MQSLTLVLEQLKVIKESKTVTPEEKKVLSQAILGKGQMKPEVRKLFDKAIYNQ